MTTATMTSDADSGDTAEEPVITRDPMAGAHPPGRRSPKELLAAAKEFQKESRARSWFHLFETMGVFALLTALIVLAPTWLSIAWPLQLALAVINGLVVVRWFIVYHDYMHNAILRGSALAKWLMYAFGVYVMVPPNVWRQTHNYHHAHTAKIVGSHVGSYLMVTTDMYKQMSPKERLMYRIYRNPLVVFFAYFTVFFYGMCVSSFLRNPRKNWDSALAAVLNVVANVAIFAAFGWQLWLFAFFLPLFVATMAGAYLFYVQHNYPEMHVQPRDTWEYTRAALESSSYFESGPIMA